MQECWSSLLKRAKSFYHIGFVVPSTSTCLDRLLIIIPIQIMQTLSLEPGDLLQIKSTDLPSGSFVKLQAQSTAFLEITDPKAVLENAMRNFSCLTKGDIFSFSYADQIFSMAVLEVKPALSSNAVSVLETDLEVDFDTPVGYVDPPRVASGSGTSTPGSHVSGPLAHAGGTLHTTGTMARAINYDSIAPASSTAAAGAKAVSSAFLAGGQKLSGKKSAASKTSTPTQKPGTPVSATILPPVIVPRRANGPQPLRLAPGTLFFGYEVKPVKKREEGQKSEDNSQPKFQGSGQSLRGGPERKRKGEDEEKSKDKAPEKDFGTGQKLGGTKR
jgi:ubiquitin fusion degradation protein 1